MSLVLVADDEPAVREVLSQVVEDLGHDVIQARDGEEAWQLARARRPNLIVTDHMMPRLSGLDLCRRVHGDEVLGGVPIILLSAVLPHGAPEAYAFLHKPFEITEFEGLIRKALAQAPRPKPLEGASAMEVLGDWVAQGFERPLTTARIELERLCAEGKADAGALETLGAQVRTLEALTRDFQEAAHLAARAVTLKPVMADLGARLSQALEVSRSRMPAVRWLLSMPESPVELRCDPARVHRMMAALLTQAGRHGGEVRVELESTPAMVTMRVKDQGPELSDEERHRLFEPFRAEGPGGGLGLYIASELARLHGGGLSVESTSGQGTTFSVVLPRG
ncbi:ATP-binding response regulator [Melittangium boletus]|uniref:histidine kinase n=1 Tax=Melittangium boletus DSM 14713 TaxID=1294270 RepID=A0A250ITV9_9BACT|nr:HAMP domain-containing sensor histidine kinase [Melittangium boletus]ATB34366.1 adenylate cyclase [Melittangium boletus DSM 14713]